MIISRNITAEGFTENQIFIDNSAVDHVEIYSNLSLIFNLKLLPTIEQMVGRIHGIVRSLWATRECTPFYISMTLAKTYLDQTLLTPTHYN